MKPPIAVKRIIPAGAAITEKRGKPASSIESMKSPPIEKILKDSKRLIDVIDISKALKMKKIVNVNASPALIYLIQMYPAVKSI